MGGEFCEQQGNSWQVELAGPSTVLDVWPAFGVRAGVTSMLLPNFRSDQLGNSRGIPVYVPSSISQNTVPRPVDVLVLMDGAEPVVRSFATNGGFEAGQAAGVVPESVMIGISTLDVVLNTGADPRPYEFTYAPQIPGGANQTCDQGPNTGGTPKLLDWIDGDVIPAVLAKLGMQRGEVSIAGGSLGGLSSCYAAASRPAVFQRAMCFSVITCYNHATGGLAPTIAQTNATGAPILPKAVLQFEGSEGLATRWGVETMWDFLVREERAWLAAGMNRGLGLAGTAAPPVAAIYPGAQWGFAKLAPVPAHAIMSLLVPGGQHAQMTWEREFAFGLQHLYRPGAAWPRGRAPLAESIRLVNSDEPPPTTPAPAPAPPSGLALDLELGFGIPLAVAFVVILHRKWVPRGERALSVAPHVEMKMSEMRGSNPGVASDAANAL